jgi:hypothetical protein
MNIHHNNMMVLKEICEYIYYSRTDIVEEWLSGHVSMISERMNSIT